MYLCIYLYLNGKILDIVVVRGYIKKSKRWNGTYFLPHAFRLVQTFKH